MEEARPAATAQPPLIDSILQYGKLAYDPELSEEIRKLNQPKFTGLLERYSGSNFSLVLSKSLTVLVLWHFSRL